MYSRQLIQKKTPEQSSSLMQSSLLKTRPFSEPERDEALLQQQQQTDLNAQLDTATQFGHNFSQVEVGSRPTIQPKLTVGAPGDQYEQEADSVASQVMSMTAPSTQPSVQREVAPEDEEVQMKPLAASITPLVQRETVPEDEEVQMKPLSGSIQRETVPEDEEVQMKPLSGSIQRETVPEDEEVQMKPLSGSIQRETVPEDEEVQMKPALQRSEEGSFEASNNIENQLSSSKGGGSPLPEGVRTFMEPRFGVDFSQVRVHTDSTAVQMNQNLGAQAFTHGQDVYFGAGKSPTDLQLTAHELTHVVQQTGGESLVQNKPLARSITPVIQRENSVIQRGGGEETAIAQADEGLISEDFLNFYPLPPLQAGILLLNGPVYTERAQELRRDFRGMGEVSQELRSSVDFLQYSENVAGEQAVESVRSVTESASQLRGSRATELRQSIDKYKEVLPKVRGKVNRVGAAEQGVIAAVSRLHRVVVGGQILTARRDEQTAEQAVSAISERQQTAEDGADQVFDATVDILTGDWKDALKDLGKFVGQELIVHNVVGAHFEEELSQAQTQLTTIRTHILSLEDEHQLASMEAAVADLNEAQQVLRAETEELPALADQAEAAHEDVYDLLNNMGGVGQDAAGALDSRLGLIQHATYAEDLTHRYGGMLTQLQESAQTLQNSYSMYADFLNSPGGEQTIPESFVRTEVWSRAYSNYQSCERLVNWITEEQPRLENIRSYIQAGSYMSHYDNGIEGALQEVRLAIPR